MSCTPCRRTRSGRIAGAVSPCSCRRNAYRRNRYTRYTTAAVPCTYTSRGTQGAGMWTQVRPIPAWTHVFSRSIYLFPFRAGFPDLLGWLTERAAAGAGAAWACCGGSSSPSCPYTSATLSPVASRSSRSSGSTLGVVTSGGAVFVTAGFGAGAGRGGGGRLCCCGCGACTGRCGAGCGGCGAGGACCGAGCGGCLPGAAGAGAVGRGAGACALAMLTGVNAGGGSSWSMSAAVGQIPVCSLALHVAAPAPGVFPGVNFFPRVNSHEPVSR